MSDLSVTSSTTLPYKPLVTSTLDLKGGLYKATLPDSGVTQDEITNTPETISTSFVYTAKGMATNSAVSSTAVFLKDMDGNYFSLDADKVSMVASGKNLNLYVYSADGTADKYTFDATSGRLQASTPTNLNAQEFSKEELAANRDLDGNGGVGAFLDKTANGGVLDTVGGLYRVKSLDQDLFVVGVGLDKAKSIDASKSTLLNADGTFWNPDSSMSTFRAVATTAKAGDKNVTTWSVYGTDADGQVTRFQFDAANKLIEDGEKAPAVMTAKDLAKVEKSLLRDLNADGMFGVEIKGTIDSKSGLFNGKVLGQDFYLVGSNLKTGTAKAGTDLGGALRTTDGDGWKVADGYTISAMVKNAPGASSSYTVYAYRTDGASPDKNDVLRYDFLADGSDFKVTADSADGIAVTATDLAAAEKLAKRDLNSDTVFGVKIDLAADSVGGLYQASALGNQFLLVGKGMTSSANNPLDLSTALKTADGEAWKPDNVATVGNSGTIGANLRIVKLRGADNDVGYKVFVKEDTAGADESSTYSVYEFGLDYKLKSNGDRQELTAEDLAAVEKTYGRDLNGDTAFGVKVTALKDAKSGLYIGSFENQTNIFIRSDTQKLTVGSKVASSGVDLSSALQTAEGYWSVEEGYTVQSAYTDADSNYVLVATGPDGAADLRRYTFGSDNKLIDDKSGDFSLVDLAAAEKIAKRDLNGDSILGARAVALDKVGGLNQATVAGQTFLVVGTKATDVKDLSQALLNADGTAWKPADGETATVLYTSKNNGQVTGYDVYTQKGTGNNAVYTRYSFDANFTYKEDQEDNAKVLSNIELADDEKDTSRDINGDKSIGAAVVAKPLDKTGGLYQASINGELMTVVWDPQNPIAMGRATKLSDRVLLDEDEASPWKVDTGYTLQAVKTEDDGTINLYATNADTGAVRRYSFNSERIFQKTPEPDLLSADQLVAAEKAVGRDINADKAVGLNVDTAAIDKKGGLYKASLLGQDYYVVGQTLKTGKTGATAIDLSKALLDPEGAAWKPADDYLIGGVVQRDDGGYDVYSYKKTGDVVSDVQKDTWDKNMSFVESSPADLVSLVEVEKTQKRDLSGDGVVGFRKIGTLTAGYLGVTEAKVAGSVTFLIAGSNVGAGTPTKPLSIKDALLNEDGSGPWTVDAGFKIKAVDDSDASKRYVYAVKAGTGGAAEEVKKFEFSRTTGQLQGAGVSVSAVELAARELVLKKDLNGDSKTGVATVTALTDGNRQTGLLTANVMGQDFLVVNKVPLAGKNISLVAALLKADGSAWAAPDGFSIKGVYQPADGNTEVYGTNDDKQIVRYSFEAKDNGTLQLITTEDNTTGEEIVSGKAFAEREATALKDLNGDGAIGFKVSTSPAIATQSNGWGIGTASVDTPDTDDSDEVNDSPTVYIVGKSLSKMGTVATNLANTAALFDGDAYWQPATGETIKSIVETANDDGSPDKVNLYAEKIDDEGGKSYVRYTFGLTGGKWTLDSAASDEDITSEELILEESSTRRDLNKDDAVGLKADSSFAVSGLSKATIDAQSYYMVGSISTGTGTRPLDQNNSKLLRGTDGKAAWVPDAAPSAWTVLPSTLPEGAPATAKYAATVDGADVYFDTNFKLTT